MTVIVKVVPAVDVAGGADRKVRGCGRRRGDHAADAGDRTGDRIGGSDDLVAGGFQGHAERLTPASPATNV